MLPADVKAALHSHATEHPDLARRGRTAL
jgi:hypothetical protein